MLCERIASHNNIENYSHTTLSLDYTRNPSMSMRFSDRRWCLYMSADFSRILIIKNQK